jgi:enoyl-CoA hydratase
LLFTGEDRIPAEEALRIGLVNRVVPRAELDDATLALAQEIAKNEPFVVQTTKRALNRAWDVAGFRAALEANTELDVMIETANLPARDEFRRITSEQGLKAAIAWRDARYRDGS